MPTSIKDINYTHFIKIDFLKPNRAEVESMITLSLQRYFKCREGQKAQGKIEPITLETKFCDLPNQFFARFSTLPAAYSNWFSAVAQSHNNNATVASILSNDTDFFKSPIAQVVKTALLAECKFSVGCPEAECQFTFSIKDIKPDTFINRLNEQSKEIAVGILKTALLTCPLQIFYREGYSAQKDKKHLVPISQFQPSSFPKEVSYQDLLETVGCRTHNVQRALVKVEDKRGTLNTPIGASVRTVLLINEQLRAGVVPKIPFFSKEEQAEFERLNLANVKAKQAEKSKTTAHNKVSTHAKVEVASA